MCVSYISYYVCLQNTVVDADSDQALTPSVCLLFHTEFSCSFLLVHSVSCSASFRHLFSPSHMCTCVQGEIVVRRATRQTRGKRLRSGTRFYWRSAFLLGIAVALTGLRTLAIHYTTSMRLR